MKQRERTVLYLALSGLTIMNVIFLLGASGRSALAAASAWLDTLGPAESVTLVEDGKEMVLRPKDGRLAWGDGQLKQTYTVAFVDISKLLNPLMESASFVEERDNLRTEMEGVEAGYKERLDAFGEELRGADQNDPQVREKMTEANALYQEYLKWGQGAIEQRNKMDVSHLQQAYREMASAVEIVADRMGVDIVLRFIPPEQDFQSLDAEGALEEIRLRTAVKYPEALDITSEVMEELSLN